MVKARQIMYYTFWLLYEVAKSSVTVTRLIWCRPKSIRPTISSVPTQQDSDVTRVIFANSITLTPGTITIFVENDRLLVHSLTTEGIEDLLSGEMDNQVKKGLC